MTQRQQGVRHVYILGLLVLKNKPAIPVDPRKRVFHEHPFTILASDIAAPAAHNARQEAVCIGSGAVASRIVATICEDLDPAQLDEH